MSNSIEKITINFVNSTQRDITAAYLFTYGYRHSVNSDGSITFYIRSNAIELSGVQSAIHKLTGDTAKTKTISFSFHPLNFA